jgi:hypothetical protein
MACMLLCLSECGTHCESMRLNAAVKSYSSSLPGVSRNICRGQLEESSALQVSSSSLCQTAMDQLWINETQMCNGSIVCITIQLDLTAAHSIRCKSIYRPTERQFTCHGIASCQLGLLSVLLSKIHRCVTYLGCSTSVCDN